MLLSQVQAPDGGLLYAETDLKQFFPEPLNTLTSCFFLLLAFFWLVRLKGFSRKHTFLSVASWLLLVGSIGGTIYHGLRKYPVFIPMDWVPILLLCLMASAWFWRKVLGNAYTTVAVLLVFFVIEWGTNYLGDHGKVHLAMNLDYALMGLMVLIPVLLFLMKTQFYEGRWVFIALASFCVALFFRVADNWRLLPIGTHFLWHTFGAVATCAMFVYIYRINSSLQLVYSPGSKDLTGVNYNMRDTDFGMEGRRQEAS